MQLHVIILCIFFVVAAHHKEPEIHIFDDGHEKEFSIIEYERHYNATWLTRKLNQDQFNEGGNISYQFRNFHWFDNKRWKNRRSALFKHSYANYTEGVVTFMQLSNRLSFGKLDISVVVLIKRTRHLNILYTSTLFSFMSNVGKGKTGAKAIMEYCNIWLTGTPDKVNSSALVSCPCNVQSVQGDPDFEIDDTCPSPRPQLKCHENVGAERCYLQRIAETYVAIYVCYVCTYVVNG